MCELQSGEVKKFSIFYDAQDSDLTSHTMDAYALGTSILELTKMIYEADGLINKEKTLDLQVTAPAREGSFAIDFAVTILNSGAIDILKYLGLSLAASSVVVEPALSVARRLKDKRIISVVTTVNSDIAEIELDGETIECDKTVAALVCNPVIRKAMNEVITQPLSNKQAPVFRVEINDVETVRLEGEATQDYTPLPNNSLSVEDVTKSETVNVTLVQINFESKNGWKMVYEDKERNVTIEDESFLQKVRDNSQSFKKGDMFEVLLDIVFKRTAKSERTQYVIRRVIRHRVTADRKLV